MAAIFDLKHVSFGEYNYVTRDDVNFYRGCTRCGGSGHYAFNGFDSICYLCGNSPAGRMGVFVGDADATAIDAAKRLKARNNRIAKREEARLAKLRLRDQRWKELKDAAPEVWELLSSIAGVSIPFEDGMGSGESKERDPFILSIADRLFNMDKFALSEKQIAAVQRTIDKRKQFPIEDGSEVVEGRVTLKGQITAVKVQESDFGTAYKVTVKDDRGFRVYVSLPKALADQAYDEFRDKIEEDGGYMGDFGPLCWFLGTDDGRYASMVKGRAVQMVATVTASKDDKSFGWGKNPAKGEFLSA